MFSEGRRLTNQILFDINTKTKEYNMVSEDQCCGKITSRLNDLRSVAYRQHGLVSLRVSSDINRKDFAF